MDTISFHSYRGGVGKTLLSVNTAVKLAMMGKKVCFIDFDLRAPSLQSYMASKAITITGRKKTFVDYIIGNSEPNKIITSTSLDKFNCIFSNIEVLHKKTKARAQLTQHGEGRILAKLFEFIRYCNTQKYDFLIIDCMPGITYRSLDALVVSDKIMVITRPVHSEIKGLELVIDECYSKLEGAAIFSIINQIERKEDLIVEPDIYDIQIAEENIQNISKSLQEGSIPIPILYSFNRIPFVTERIYVLEEENHPFSQEIGGFCKVLLNESK